MELNYKRRLCPFPEHYYGFAPAPQALHSHPARPGHTCPRRPGRAGPIDGLWLGSEKWRLPSQLLPPFNGQRAAGNVVPWSLRVYLFIFFLHKTGITALEENLHEKSRPALTILMFIGRQMRDMCSSILTWQRLKRQALVLSPPLYRWGN